LTLSIIVIVVSLLISAFISGTEAALIATNKVRIRHMVRQGDKRAAAVYKILTRPEDFFGVILLINNLVNVLAATLIGALTAELIGGSAGLAVGVATGVSTLIIVIFSELTPKSFATATAERWSLAVGGIITFLMLVLGPLIWFFTYIPKGINKIVGGQDSFSTPIITPGELRMLIDMGEEQGIVDSSQGTMLDNIFRFGETEVRDVMTPRTEIVWVDSGTTMREFLATYRSHPHTRFPVFDTEHDDIVGVLSVKDVMGSMADNKLDLAQPVTRLMRAALFIPETKRLDDLFTMMQQTGHKVALAVDEYGDVAGLMTLTRVVEQIVGRTGEEGHRPERRFITVNENTYVVDGGMSIEEANAELHLGIPEGGYETVAGFFLEMAQRIPTIGARVRYGGVRLQVAEMDGNRITSVRVRRIQQTPESVPAQVD